MTKEFYQQQWNTELHEALVRLFLLAIGEDSGEHGDLTCLALIPESATGSARVVAREKGTVAGAALVPSLVKLFDARLLWKSEKEDGQLIQKGECVGEISGPVTAILGVERLVLNLLGHLSGVASLTAQFVQKVKGTKARIYDTRKTLPGWRRLEKYAVRCGGGQNHRMGLYDHILIKDNHLAFGSEEGFTPAQAVQKAREFLRLRTPVGQEPPIVEIEVDSLEQFALVLPETPDIVLLDNMGPDRLREAVRIRNEVNPAVQLEASGGITLETVHDIAMSGVERVSSGSLTHSAQNFDYGLDWK